MNYEKWKQLADEGYSSDAISLLSFLKNGEVLDEEHPKSMAIYQFLVRKDLVHGSQITPFGEELLKSTGITGEIPEKPKKVDKFEEWWKTYPATNNFEVNGVKFQGVQSKHKMKDKSKKEFQDAIKEGFTADEIIGATAFHINQAKQLSLKKKENQLTFIANSERYLRERMFQDYIQFLGDKVEEEPVYKSKIL